MRVLFLLAWRNLWRNHRRTLIMLTAIAFGVWAMIFMTALTQGMVTEMVRDGIRVLPGHVKALNPDYLDDPTVSNVLPLSDAEIGQRLGEATPFLWTTRLAVPAVISSEYETRGVRLLGVDPAREMKISFLQSASLDGRFLEGVDDDGLVIGDKLARELDTRLGKRVVIMSQTPDNEIADRGIRVVGVYHADMEAWEETYVFAGRETVQRLLGVPGGVTEVIAMGDDFRDVDGVYDAVRQAMPDSVEVRRWTELDRYLATMLDVMDGFVLVWVVVVFLALSFGLVNTLVMAVFERVREIGLMLALGMKPVSILGQIMIESMLLLLIGLAAGNLLAIASIQPLESGIDLSLVAEGMAIFGASAVFYPDLRADDILLANVVVIVLGFLASLSPAWRASRYDPVAAIHKVD